MKTLLQIALIVLGSAAYIFLSLKVKNAALYKEKKVPPHDTISKTRRNVSILLIAGLTVLCSSAYGQPRSSRSRLDTESKNGVRMTLEKRAVDRLSEAESLIMAFAGAVCFFLSLRIKNAVVCERRNGTNSRLKPKRQLLMLFFLIGTSVMNINAQSQSLSPGSTDGHEATHGFLSSTEGKVLRKLFEAGPLPVENFAEAIGLGEDNDTAYQIQFPRYIRSRAHSNIWTIRRVKIETEAENRIIDVLASTRSYWLSLTAVTSKGIVQDLSVYEGTALLFKVSLRGGYAYLPSPVDPRTANSVAARD